MYQRKTTLIIASLFALTAVMISACEMQYSQAPLTTPTTLPTSLFVSPFPTSDNPMAMVEALSTGTALAETAVALTAGTPMAINSNTPTPGAGGSTTGTPGAEVTANATGSGIVATATPALGAGTPIATIPLPTTITNRPGSYTLQAGEFPYCIARRFNVDPGELLNLNGLSDGGVYYSNLTLDIPTTGNPFPGERALRSHPDTYTVADASITLYGIACIYGDVDPAAIAQANNLQLSTTLTIGQTLNIP